MEFKAKDLTANSTTTSTTFTADGTVIVGLLVANTSDTSDVKVNVSLRDKYVLKNVTIPYGSSLSALDGKLIANNADELKVVTDGESVDVIISYLEN